MSTGSSVRSLSAISLASASIVVLGRQKTTSSRITVLTAGSAASGARRSGSRFWSWVMGSTERTNDWLPRPEYSRGSGRPGPPRRGLLGAARPGRLLLGEAAQHVLPGLGLGRRLGGSGGGGAAVDPGAGALDLALAALLGGGLGGGGDAVELAGDGVDGGAVAGRTELALQAGGGVGAQVVAGLADAVLDAAAGGVELAVGARRLGALAALLLVEGAAPV